MGFIATSLWLAVGTLYLVLLTDFWICVVFIEQILPAIHYWFEVFVYFCVVSVYRNCDILMVVCVTFTLIDNEECFKALRFYYET